MSTDPDAPHLNGAAPTLVDGLQALDVDDDATLASPPPVEELPPLANPTPAEVAELSASCARFVLAKYKVPLDGTHETLSILDQYVRDAREDVKMQPAGLPLLVATVGAYFGEVLRRAFDASWFASGDHDGWRLDFHDVYLTLNPLGMAREALTLEDAEGWHAHLEMDEAEKEHVLGRLAQMPEVSDDEYYAPTTRFDVIELAVEALRAQAHTDGLASVRFTAEDYRKR